MEISLVTGRKIFFLSDAHLGSPDPVTSLARERMLVGWLNTIRSEAQEIFLLGDIFDFWFEYRKVVPKGFVRLMGKLAELADEGIPIHYFSGNHDMWMYGYFEKEIGMSIHHDPLKATINGKNFFIGHGDGLGPGDHSYKFTKRIFKSRIARWLFARLHPNFGVGLAHRLSQASRSQNGHKDTHFLGDDKEFLISFAREYEKSNKVDYFIFGHRHFPIRRVLPGGATYMNLGDWVQHFSYAVFDGTELSLQSYKAES